MKFSWGRLSKETLMYMQGYLGNCVPSEEAIKNHEYIFLLCDDVAKDWEYTSLAVAVHGRIYCKSCKSYIKPKEHV